MRVSDSSRRVHGGIDPRELDSLGLSVGDVIDFSVNINPYGAAPSVLEAIRGAAVDRYPEPTARGVREALGSLDGVAAERIVVGNGATELLWSLARTLLGPGDGVVIVEPTFSEFRAAAEHCGARIIEWRARAIDDWRVDLTRLPVVDARVLYLCAPNSPTGTAIPLAELTALATAHPELTIIVDQAFLSLSECYEQARIEPPANVVRVRSLTKAHAIPGVRIGYLLTDQTLARRVEAGRPAWSTSCLAQAAALAACREGRWVARCRERMLADRRRLAAELEGLGCAPRPTRTTFFLLPVDSGSDFRRRLLQRGVLVRDCSSFGLPEFVRLGARPETDRLLEAIACQPAR